MLKHVLLVAVVSVSATWATFIWPSDPVLHLPRTNEPTNQLLWSRGEPTIRLPCPVDGGPRSITFNAYDVQLPADPEDPVHDELRRRRRALEETPPLNIFEAHILRNPDWRSRWQFYFCTSQLQRHVNSGTGQQYFYRREYGGLTGRPVSSYVATVVRPEFLGTGQATRDASRRYTNSLVQTSGLLGRSQRDPYQSFDAGHILGNQLGGLVEDWNLYPQNGQLNRQLWNNLETDVANRIRRDNYVVIVEYHLQYGNYPTVPDYVHYSYRFFSPSGHLVDSINGMYPNQLPDGTQRVYRMISQEGIGGEVVYEESSLTRDLNDQEVLAGRILAVLGFREFCRRNP